eukprot:676713-Pleurochrysis_carterae.AAC.1
MCAISYERPPAHLRVKVWQLSPWGRGVIGGTDVAKIYNIKCLVEWILSRQFVPREPGQAPFNPKETEHPGTRRSFSDDEIVTYLHHPEVRNDPDVETYLQHYFPTETLIRRQLPRSLWHLPSHEVHEVAFGGERRWHSWPSLGW